MVFFHLKSTILASKTTFLGSSRGFVYTWVWWLFRRAALLCCCTIRHGEARWYRRARWRKS